MTTTDRLAPLFAGILIAALVISGLVYAAHELTVALERIAL